MAIKSFNVPDEVREYLDTLPNASAYVSDLVKRDMEKNQNAMNVDLEELVRGMVKSALNEGRRSTSGGIRAVIE